MPMHPIQQKLALYLEEGKFLDGSLVANTAASVRDAMHKQFTEERGGFKVRISGIGKPLCQQQMEQMYDKGLAEKEPDTYDFKMRMVTGDLLEALILNLMSSAGIDVEETHTKVSYSFTREGKEYTIDGTLDCVIDGKVYDVKTCSPYAFTHKFSGGFTKLKADDPFGYVEQLALYAKALGKPAGGWIAINKSTGEVVVCEVPSYDNTWMKEALKRAEDAAVKLYNNAPFKREYEPIKETYYKKESGNLVLPRVCTYCSFKQSCWEGMVTHRDSVVSKKNPTPKVWYYGEVQE